MLNTQTITSPAMALPEISSANPIEATEMLLEMTTALAEQSERRVERLWQLLERTRQFLELNAQRDFALR